MQFKNTIAEDLFHPLEIEGLSEVTFVLELQKAVEYYAGRDRRYGGV